MAFFETNKTKSLPTTIIALRKFNIDFSNEEKQQEDYKKIKGKYCQVKEIKDGDVKKSITEYVCPNGEVGYQILLKKTIKGKEYMMSKGHGQEAKSRTFNWIEIIIE